MSKLRVTLSILLLLLALLSIQAQTARGKAINLSDSENVENLEIALKRGAVITGRVTDSNDKPLVEQRVELTGLDERGQPLRAAPGVNPFMYSTDDRGVYRIYGLPAGRYLVSAGFAQREGSITMTVNRVTDQVIKYSSK